MSNHPPTKSSCCGLLAVLSLLPLAACYPSIPAMTAEESQRVEQLSAHMSARCIGRYLIDLPAVFVLNSQSVTEIEGVKISVRPMTKENFEMAWATRGAELEKTVLLSSKLPMLRSIVPLPAGQLGGVFDRAEDKFRGRLGRTLELMAWKDGYQILGEIKATDNTFPEYETGSIAKSLETDVPQKLSHLLEIYEKIRGRADDEIPDGRGFCFPYGIYEAASKEDEKTYISYHLENVRDVYFHLGANPEKLKGQETLLERSASVMLEMKISGVETIRKGKVTYQALPYEEWLMKGPTPARVPGTMFTLLGNQTTRGVGQPFMRVELFNGYDIPAPERTPEESANLKDLEHATLSDGQAVALWDKVTPTLRPRPGAF